MILVRKPESIYQVDGTIRNGGFHGRWHFSFGNYHDPEFEDFGTLRVFNDDTLTPGAIWPLHPHHDNEVVTYCAGGEFRHADERGQGGVLKKGWVQHTTVGIGMWHSEINNRPDEPMRFIQMWFYPSKRGLKPSVEQKAVEKEDRTDRFLPLVSNRHEEALPIISDADVFSCFLEGGKTVHYELKPEHGAYIYILEGGPVKVNRLSVPTLGAAMIFDEDAFDVFSEQDAELLLVDVLKG